MRFYQANYGLIILAVLMWMATTALVPIGDAYATDCDTDCDRACNTKLGVDPFCRSRCLLEKTLACETRADSCDLWRAYPDFYGTVKAIETASQAGWLKSAQACYEAVDNGGMSYTVLSTAYKYATTAAKFSLKGTILGGAFQEAVVHHLNCACSAANYSVAGAGVSPSRDTFCEAQKKTLAEATATGLFVDRSHPGIGIGTREQPYRSLEQAVNLLTIPDVPGCELGGGTVPIIIRGGMYPERPTLNLPIVLLADGGLVTIGE